MPVSVRARRAAVALVAAFLGLFFTAGPAAASTVRVAVDNGGSDPLLIKVSQDPGFNMSVSAGCGAVRTAPLAAGTAFAICLPGGAILVFAADV